MTDPAKTSVYLPGDIREYMEASGLKASDLLRRGYEAALQQDAAAAMTAALEGLLAPLTERVRALEKALTASGVPSHGSDSGKPPAARTEPRARPAQAVPKSQRRARDVTAAARLVGENPRAALRALQSVTLPAVTPGTQVFQEPGADPVASHPVPAARKRATR